MGLTAHLRSEHNLCSSFNPSKTERERERDLTAGRKRPKGQEGEKIKEYMRLAKRSNQKKILYTEVFKES